jgi:hypothetical protein
LAGLPLRNLVDKRKGLFVQNPKPFGASTELRHRRHEALVHLLGESLQARGIDRGIRAHVFERRGERALSAFFLVETGLVLMM